MLTDLRLLKSTLGREGWCQRLLTELILDAPYPPYNSRRRPSPRGVAFLGALDELCFGVDEVTGEDPIFVDEIDFPARHADEQGCAPDYTVFVGDRCWIIELKTEPGSHRPRQIPDYFERAHHYHPGLRVDLTYLTAGLRSRFQPDTRAWERYAHVHWARVADLIQFAWADADAEHAVVVRALIQGIAHLHEPPRQWWRTVGYDLKPLPPVEYAATADAAVETASAPSVGDALEEGLALASATAADGRQRAIGLELGGLEALHELRLALRVALQAQAPAVGVGAVQPWVWSSATSGGKPMTTNGGVTGYEVRLSRSRSTGRRRR